MKTLISLISLVALAAPSGRARPLAPGKPLSDIRLRDPFIVPVAEDSAYYMFGTGWTLPDGPGFMVYRSPDLLNWSGPEPAFRPPEAFWATRDYWAPEVHRYRGRYYLFGGIEGVTKYRMSENLHGPWECPPVDVVDSPRAYVMKTAPFTGGRRIGVAWIGHQNAWGGHTLFREI